ncbi:MAG: hypothetical protein JW987_12655 [Anaerolineaceae bacterium]|nr:hypothetical protein [Anaerolineaceae bacterium]
MIHISSLNTEEKLAGTLGALGFDSEAVSIRANEYDETLLRKLTVARRLTGEGYRNLLVESDGDVLRVYDWIMLVCELHGDVAEADIIEKVNLAAFPERAPSDPEKCICLDLPQPFNHYEKVKFVGRDETNGRFGEVNLRRCLHCGRLWVHYFVEYEAFRASGRYYMGIITAEDAQSLTAETAVDYLNSLDWHLFGGSFFDGVVGLGTGHVYVDC